MGVGSDLHDGSRDGSLLLVVDRKGIVGYQGICLPAITSERDSVLVHIINILNLAFPYVHILE